MARSQKTPKTKSKKQTYTVTLELMTPVQCTFEVEAKSPEEAIDQAMDLDWDDYENVGADGDGPTYCVLITDEKDKELPIPKGYGATITFEESN